MKLSGAMLALAAVAFAADTPQPASTLIGNAKIEAARSHRAIWVLFDASW
jgi:hypothetical protein